MLFGEEIENSEKSRRSINLVPSYTLQSGIGISDNPLYAPFIQQEAVYWENSLEGFFLFESTPDFFTYLYLYGEGKNFEELPEQKSTSIYLGQVEHAYTPSESDQTYGVRFRHIYYDQGFDYSELGFPYSFSVQSNKSEFISYFTKKFSEELTATFEILLAEEDFKVITDDNKVSGLSLILKSTPGLLNWTFQAEYLQKRYEERLRRNWDSTLIAGGKLENDKLNFSIIAEKESDMLPWKNSKAKLIWSQLQDNGGSYYDYDKFSLSFKQDLIVSSYNIEFMIGGAFTKYDQRLIENIERFELKSLSNGLSITREISDNLETYIRWSREEDISNSRDYEYSSNFWSLGVIWEI